MKKLHESAVVFSFRGESMSHNAQHFQYSVELIKMNEYFRVYLMPKHGPHSHLLSCECLCVCVCCHFLPYIRKYRMQAMLLCTFASI